MNQRPGFPWVWALGTLVIAAIVGVGAFIAGHTNEVVTTNPAAGRVIDGGYGYGYGFFHFFGFLFFLLLVFLLFGLFRRGWGGGWGRGHWGGGPYGGGYWHQHSHEHGQTTPPTTPPAGGGPDQPKSA